MIENCAVNTIEYSPGNYIVHTKGEQSILIHSNFLVNASGAWTNRILELLQIDPVCKMLPLQLHITEPFLEIKVPYFLQIANRKLSFKQMQNGSLIIGGGWQGIGNPNPFFAENDTVKISKNSLYQNIKNAVDLVPSITNLKLKSIKRSYAAWTLDGVPIVGQLESCGIYTALGGNGYTYGPLYGKVLAQLINKENINIDLTTLNPNRVLKDFPTMGSTVEESSVNFTDICNYSIGQLINSTDDAAYNSIIEKDSIHNLPPS
ncbi:MAG: FAD-binding oxidoreductase [Chitinophagaceae bacterium]|nr:FAD-binding oxidoreductase [Chitinophagaceae bacterium]